MDIMALKVKSIIITLLFLFAAYTPAHATMYFYYDAENETVGSSVPRQLNGIDICTQGCASIGSDATVQSAGGAPQGSKYFQWVTVDNQHSVYTEVVNHTTFPISLSLGTTYYLAYFFNFTRINGLDIWHETGQSADKGVEMTGSGIRWIISRGNWSCIADTQDHYYTVWAGNPTYVLNPSPIPNCVDNIFGGNQNGYSASNPIQLQYERWHSAVMAVKIASNNTGSVAFWINGVKIAEYNNIITAANSSPTINYITMGGTIAQSAYDAPAHYRKFDALMLTDNWQDIVDGGYLNGSGDNTPPPSSGGSGGDSSASGGGGCGFVKDDGKGQGAKGEGLVLMIMLFIALVGIILIKKRAKSFFIVFFLLLPINLNAATLEVGTGKTYSTIQAAANAANAGDTILVFPGTYNERVTLPLGKTGTVGNKIIFKSQTSRAAFMNGFETGNANYLRIEGFDISYNAGGWYGGGIWINNSSYVEIVDNYFHDIPGQAINPNWSSGVTHNNIYVANNKIYRVNQGIIARGNDWLVENNDIERLVGAYYDADYTRFFGENITFRNNYFHGTFQNEIGTSHTDGFQTFAANPGEYAKNIIIEGNVVRDFYHQGLMLEGKTGTHDNLIVRNNIFADAASWGIAAHGIANLYVLNNNFINMLIHGVGFRATSDGTPTTGIVQNNIFYNGGTNYWKETTCAGCVLTGGYNIITVEKYPYYKESTDLIGVDPLFVNANGYNFHLQSGSPAIDAGTSSVAAVVTTDFDGNARPMGAGYDIGAYEVIDPNAPTVQITSPTIANTYPSSGAFSGDLALSGTATPASGRSISSVTCTNSSGGSCSCSGTDSWSCNTAISSGQTNVNITIKATDNNSSSGIDVLVVNPNTGGGGGGGGNTPPPSSGGSGGDASSSGGSGCGFVKDDGKGQGAKGEGLAFAMMLIIIFGGISLAKKMSIFWAQNK